MEGLEEQFHILILIIESLPILTNKHFWKKKQQQKNKTKKKQQQQQKNSKSSHKTSYINGKGPEFNHFLA